MGIRDSVNLIFLLDMIPQSSSPVDLNPGLHISTTYNPPVTTLSDSITNLYKSGLRSRLYLSTLFPVSTRKLGISILITQ